MNGPAVDVIVVPWDSGRRGWRMGAGPLHLLERGLRERLDTLGLDTHVIVVEPAELPPSDPTGTFAVAEEIARHVQRTRAHRRFPLVLAGNCSSALGTVSGMGAASAGVIWFDAHGDFNTPETSASGFLDGMALAMLAGRCAREQTARIPGFRPVAEDTVVHAGARDLDDAERPALERSGVRVVAPGGAISEQLAAAVEGWPDAVVEAYVHVDLDVLDADEATVNEYATAGGITLPDLLACIDAVATHVPIGAAALTALDPIVDADGRATAAAFAVIEQLLARAEPGGAA